VKIRLIVALFAVSATAAEYAGLTGRMGAEANAKRVNELRITYRASKVWLPSTIAESRHVGIVDENAV
jgi:hypothetical protein